MLGAMRLPAKPLHPDLVQARAEMAAHRIPRADYFAWKAQRQTALYRGIPFRFGLLAWREWWLLELAKLEPGEWRGRRRDQYGMARFNDAGAFEPGNVLCLRHERQMRNRPPELRRQVTEKARRTRAQSGHSWGEHLKVRGDGHPKSHAVLTPVGRFGSMALAAEAFGVTRQTVGSWVRDRRPGWHKAGKPAAGIEFT